jgi:hypothetical protein
LPSCSLSTPQKTVIVPNIEWLAILFPFFFEVNGSNLSLLTDALCFPSSPLSKSKNSVLNYATDTYKFLLPSFQFIRNLSYRLRLLWLTTLLYFNKLSTPPNQSWRPPLIACQCIYKYHSCLRHGKRQLW